MEKKFLREVDERINKDAVLEKIEYRIKELFGNLNNLSLEDAKKILEQIDKLFLEFYHKESHTFDIDGMATKKS